jgi:hypothetical protein
MHEYILFSKYETTVASKSIDWLVPENDVLHIYITSQLAGLLVLLKTTQKDFKHETRFDAKLIIYGPLTLFLKIVVKTRPRARPLPWTVDREKNKEGKQPFDMTTEANHQISDDKHLSEERSTNQSRTIPSKSGAARRPPHSVDRR